LRKRFVGLIIVLIDSFITWDQKPEKLSIKEAPPADDMMQKFLQKAAKKHGVECPLALAWHKMDDGYVCDGGGHKLTFAQLGIEEAAEKPSVKSVEEKVSGTHYNANPRSH
jgi:hypothetical protein